jgi:hypothetical protein
VYTYALVRNVLLNLNFVDFYVRDAAHGWFFERENAAVDRRTLETLFQDEALREHLPSPDRMTALWKALDEAAAKGSGQPSSSGKLEVQASGCTAHASLSEPSGTCSDMPPE